jgi:hypothetical protein
VIARLRRAVVAPFAVASALALAGVLVPGVAVAKAPNPLADPTSNTAPSQRFLSACRDMTTSTAANRRCDKAALPDFDAVRKKEGLGPMALPRDFASLSVPAQLLAISDIERVDRGRRAVLGMTKSLNKLAQQGADNDQDPPFPAQFPGNSGGGNWAAAGNSVLLDDFYWMYDDGLGSFNGDCTQSNQSGCWGHRHDIINAYDARVVMGAAVAYNTHWGTSMTEEFIGGDANDKVNVSPSWHTISATFPPRLAISASRATVVAGHAVTLTGRVSTHVTHKRVAGQRVQLQQRRSTTGRWTAVASRRSGSHGVVHFVVHPSHAESYRLVGLTKSGSPDGHSAGVRIAIA